MVKRSAWFIVAAMLSGVIYAWGFPKRANDWLTDHQLAALGDLSWIAAPLSWVTQPQSLLWIMVFLSALVLAGYFVLPSDTDEDTSRWQFAIILLTTVVAIGYRLVFGADAFVGNDDILRDPAVFMLMGGYVLVMLLIMTQVRLPGLKVFKKRLGNEDYRCAKGFATGDYSRDLSRLWCLCDRAPDPAHHRCPPGYVSTLWYEQARKRPFLHRLFGWGIPRDKGPKQRSERISYLVHDPSEDPRVP